MFRSIRKLSAYSALSALSALSSVAAATAALLATTGAVAQEFPSKPLRIVVPYVPGGVTDILGRTVASGLTKVLGQSAVVENRPGAGGAIGTEQVVRSPADGYTLVITSPGIPTYQIFNKMTWDPVKDLNHISILVDGQLVMWTHVSSPYNGFNEMIAYARANPGKLNFGTPGLQSNVTMFIEGMKQKFGADVVIAPFKGTAEIRTAMASQSIQVATNDIGTATAEAQAGRGKPLAVTGPRRIAAFPNLPTFGELGHNDFIFSFWLGIAAPAATPAPIVAKISNAVMATMQSPEARDIMAKSGLDIVATTPEAANKRIQAEAVYFTTVAQKAGIKPQ
jgi:tripartite-type tricarboxylate transporter receptor subunit TctC